MKVIVELLLKTKLEKEKRLIKIKKILNIKSKNFESVQLVKEKSYETERGIVRKLHLSNPHQIRKKKLM